MAYMSQEGYDKLVAELQRLEAIERPKASAAIAEARDKGDLSENSEYDAAKEVQAHLESKINKLKLDIAEAKIVDVSRLSTDAVQIMSKVEMTNRQECLMIQSALRVSYTSPKVMHWITRLLVRLFISEVSLSQLTKVAERIAAEAVKDNFLDLDNDNYELGVQTPHVVFNYLDYLLWKEDKEKYEDFVFEFRNSVEHWYPQNPSKGTIEAWDGRDTFGNLCIISRSVNSKFSNLSPESKMQTFERMVQRGSLKLRIMGNIIKGGSDQDWVKHACREHEEEMLELLKKRTEELLR